MEALHHPVLLRVGRSVPTHLTAPPDQPPREHRRQVGPAAAPRPAVIHAHPLGRSPSLQLLDQPLLHEGHRHLGGFGQGGKAPRRARRGWLRPRARRRPFGSHPPGGSPLWHPTPRLHGPPGRGTPSPPERANAAAEAPPPETRLAGSAGWAAVGRGTARPT